jgi:hypothetical protein
MPDKIKNSYFGIMVVLKIRTRCNELNIDYEYSVALNDGTEIYHVSINAE